MLAPEDERGRPAVQTLQLGKVDAMTVKAKAEQKQRHEETGEHDAPAGVAQRRLVGLAVRSCAGIICFRAVAPIEAAHGAARLDHASVRSRKASND